MFSFYDIRVFIFIQKCMKFTSITIEEPMSRIMFPLLLYVNFSRLKLSVAPGWWRPVPKIGPNANFRDFWKILCLHKKKKKKLFFNEMNRNIFKFSVFTTENGQKVGNVDLKTALIFFMNEKFQWNSMFSMCNQDLPATSFSFTPKQAKVLLGQNK